MSEYRLYWMANTVHDYRVYMGKDGRPTSNQSAAQGYTADEVLEKAITGRYCIDKIEPSPPDLSVHITDGMGSQDRVGG